MLIFSQYIHGNIGSGKFPAILKNGDITAVFKNDFKGAYYKFFEKNFVAQETIDLNSSWPSNFFRKYFMALPINFSFLSKAYF